MITCRRVVDDPQHWSVSDVQGTACHSVAQPMLTHLHLLHLRHDRHRMSTMRSHGHLIQRGCLSARSVAPLLIAVTNWLRDLLKWDLLGAGSSNVQTCSAPALYGPHIRVRKHFMRSKLPVSETKKNIVEQTGRKFALLHTKIYVQFVWQKFNRTRSFGLSFWRCG